jgi:tetratricopeptide (TPR) repeat protein
MLPYKDFKPFIVTILLAFLINGCGAPRTVTPTHRTQAPEPSSHDVMQEEVVQPPRQEQMEKLTAVPGPTSEPVKVLESAGTTELGKLKLDYADIQFVQLRLDEYEKKFESWLEFSELMQEEDWNEELTATETECVQQLERILSGYNLLLEKMHLSGYSLLGRMQPDNSVPLANTAIAELKKMQQLDIAFLESSCPELLALDMAPKYEFLPGAAEPKFSFAAAQEMVSAHMAQGDYQEALLSYDRLALDFPGQTPSLSTRMNYGLALQYTGQIEEAAEYYKNMLTSDDLAIGPISLQREIADLFLASGNFTTAESFYDNVLTGHDSIGVEKKWAEEQLAFLDEVDPDSEDMAAYMSLLREFQMYDYRTDAPRLNEAINAFAIQYTGSPIAVSALRLKAFAKDQLKSWFNRQLVRVNALVAEKKFAEAAEILESMTRYYLPAELQTTLQKTYYEVSQSENQEIEMQQQIHEIELTEQWDMALKLLDSQRYDSAISAFTALMDTEYEEQATIKITEAANQAASKMRKEAASLFVRAGRNPDIEQKKELLLASHRLLSEIVAKYPQTDLLDKVHQNIAILEEQIQRFDPALLEELQQETPADPSGPFTRQLQ